MQQECQAIIDQLFDELSNAKKAWGPNKLVNADLFQECLEDLQVHLQNETAQSMKIVTERQKILESANRTAENIEKEARARANQMVDEHQITVQANQNATKIIGDAKEKASAIIIEAQNQANGIQAQCDKDCTDKKEATKRFIGKQFIDADNNIESAILSMNEISDRLTKNINDIRALYSLITTSDEYSFLNDNNN